MNDQDLRDCFAMFAMLGILIRGDEVPIKTAYNIADQMLELRKYKEPEVGIKTVKRTRRANDQES
jgi:hypothetical protein